MKCERLDLGNGDFVITCRQRRAACSSCAHREHDVLCDAPLAGKRAGKTCSRKLCRGCAVALAPGLDLCMPHAKIHRAAAMRDAGAVMLERGMDGARDFYVAHRGDGVALLGLADTLRIAGATDESGKVIARIDAALVARMGGSA